MTRESKRIRALESASDREGQLAAILEEVGLLGPLLTIAIEQWPAP
jgi:hypothetical protein